MVLEKERSARRIYVNIVQDMYRSSKTQVVTQKGEIEYFPIEVGLHQGSALSPLLFIIIMDVLTENIENDRKMPVKLKDKIFKTIIRPAMTYGSECWAVKKKDENKLN